MFTGSINFDDVLWGVDPYAIEALREFINWGNIRAHKYFMVRENGGLELRIATLRSCGRKDSVLLNHEFLGITDNDLLLAVAECERIGKGSHNGDYAISSKIKKALLTAFAEGKL